MRLSRWLFIVITLINPEWWDLTWAPSDANRWIVIAYHCPLYYAVNVFDLEPGTSEARVHRLDPPGTCQVTFSVVQGESPERGLVVEYLSLED